MLVAIAAPGTINTRAIATTIAAFKLFVFLSIIPADNTAWSVA